MTTESTIMEIELVDGPLEVADWEHRPSGGAQCVFTGMTRPEHHPEHGDLAALVYEAQRTMALAEMKQLAEEAAQRWKPLAIRLHHSTGLVAVGQISVLIQVVTLHRREAFLSCQWLIDSLKERVPIWKQESWNRGQTWPEGTPLRAQAKGSS